MKTREPAKVDTVVRPDGTADPDRARFAAALFEELATPPGSPETWVSGTYDADADSDDWLGDAASQAMRLANAELATLAARVGSAVGPYRLTSLLGRGGMGAVFAAERADGAFAQRVALKLIIGGGSRLASRFRRERAILARLDHPHIARLLDGGLSTDGEPWFAMELVDGVSLTGYCETQALDVRARIRLFLQVCDAVAYAHRHLIVHRDLKPPNVLVTNDGKAKLLDFGIAKLIDRSREETELTRADERVLTPDYAAPEQILGQPITTATDVYALGLLLYEMLTGQRAQQLSGKSALEAERWVVNQDVGAPSELRCTHARALAGDLDAIVSKALRKEPEHRYATAQALADDLRRHLDGHAVHARAGTWSYRAGKFARRNRVAIAASLAVFAALLVGLVGALWQAREARLQAERAESVKDFVTELFRTVDPARLENGGREITVQELLDGGAARLETRLDGQPEDQAEILLTLSDMYAALGRTTEPGRLAQQALDLQRSMYGPDDVRLIPAIARALQRNVTSEAQARRLTRDAERLLDGADSSYDDDRLIVLYTTVRRANRAGDFAASETAARRILALQEQRFGPDSPELGLGLTSLAWAYGWQNRYEEADALYRRALALLPKLESDDRRRPSVFMHMHLGNLATHRGRYAEAADEYRKSLAFAVEVFGPEHPQTQTMQQSVLYAQFHLGRAAEAEAGLRAMYDGRELGLEERRFIEWFLGRVLIGRGKVDEASRHLRRALDVTHQAHGADSKLAQFIARDLGGALADVGETAEARRVLEQALMVLERLETTSSHQYALIETRYARLLLANGEAVAAEPRARHAHKVLTEKMDPDYDETARAAHELGRALLLLGRQDEALPHLRFAARNYEMRFGRADVRTAEYRFVLGEALHDSAPPEARELLDTAARALVAVDGNVLPARARAERWLAEKKL